jgi:heme/copper-type cytochrome/quinol oxidase subunit 3
MADSSFGSTFFIATGFHGLHVIIGSIFLVISLIRFNKLINSYTHIVGFECAAWYWHFVDVVWLFLYSILYWWGAYFASTIVHLISNKKDQQKIKFYIIFVSATILLFVFIIVITTLRSSIYINKEKWSQFECGFNLINPPHLPFSFQFFLIAILFLIFDIEIALVLSYPMETKDLKTFSTTLIFILGLTIALLYEWQKGKIEWSK